jgi:thioredoxin 1
MKMLYFTAPGCGVCHALKPKVQDMVQREFPQIDFREVKVNEEPQISGQHLVFTVPAIIVLENDKEALRMVGNMGLNQLHSKLAQLFE